MPYGFGPSNVGLDDSMRGTLAQECEPSTVPRPTGLCKRFAMNVPPSHPYINPDTGVRRKFVCPKLEFDESCTDMTDIDTEVEEDFSQAEEDCKLEMYGGMPAAPMPWGSRVGGSHGPSSVFKLENLIKEEAEEIERSRKYMKHADVKSFPPQKGFWDLSSLHRNRARAGLSAMDTDNLDPDVAAAMMASEEQGQVLKHIPPHALFNRLFPEDNRKCTVLIKGASKYHRDHVVPERGAMLQDCLMSDVDAGIIPYGDIAMTKTEALPQPIYHPGQDCPDGICESPHKKHAKVSKLRSSVDEDHVELTWASPKENVKGFQVYVTPATPDKKSAKDANWQSFFVSTPKADVKWDSMGPHTEGLHIAVSPILADAPAPPTPNKDMSKLDVKRPKHSPKKSPKGKGKGTGKVENVTARNAPGGIELEWDTPPSAANGALIQFKSDAHTKMQYKVAKENEVILPVPEKQGKVYIAMEPRVPRGFEHPEVVEMIYDMKQGRIELMEVKEKEEDDDTKPKYHVSSMPPLSGNFIQLRGSQPPLWFPGYFTIQPGVASIVTLNEPNDALEKAWASMGPAQVDSPHGNFLLGRRWDDPANK